MKDEALAKTIQDLFKMQEKQARRLIGDTTVTAYRRVHEVATSSLERTHEFIRRKNPKQALPLLIKSLILINYQEAREQLSKGLANILREVFNNIISGASKGTINEQAVERARILLDALAVLVYQYGKKR